MPKRHRTYLRAKTSTGKRPLALDGAPAYTVAPPMPALSLHTPLGPLTVSQDGAALVALDWGWGSIQTETPLLARARDQLQLYFDGSLRAFDLPLAPAGSAYRQRVWAALQDIPFGQTCSYATLATRAGGSARSIGGANGANPIPIIIPCHRVVGSAGIGGYSGGEGIATKRWLLALEQNGEAHRGQTSLQDNA